MATVMSPRDMKRLVPTRSEATPAGMSSATLVMPMLPTSAPTMARSTPNDSAYSGSTGASRLKPKLTRKPTAEMSTVALRS